MMQQGRPFALPLPQQAQMAAVIAQQSQPSQLAIKSPQAAQAACQEGLAALDQASAAASQAQDISMKASKAFGRVGDSIETAQVKLRAAYNTLLQQ